MNQAKKTADWAYLLLRWGERWGWRSAWLFHAAVAVATAAGVVVVLVGLDGVPGHVALGVAVLAVVPAVVAGAVALELARALAMSDRQRQALRLDDPLSGVSHRRQFLRIAEREWIRCQREGDHGALLLIGPDNLRAINENQGHRCGNQVLTDITGRVFATLRQSDVLGRFGGAELAIFLPLTDAPGALDAADRIRQLVAAKPFVWEGRVVGSTVSVGVAQVHAGQTSLNGLIQEAEAALQQAKAAGRNCVRAAPAAAPQPLAP